MKTGASLPNDMSVVVNDTTFKINMLYNPKKESVLDKIERLLKEEISTVNS